MQAADVMTTNVITVPPETGVREIARLLLKRRISAVPVVDTEQRALGIVSEGDLMRRAENDTDRRSSWWLEAIASTHEKTTDYIKTHGRTAGDVMTRDVVTVKEDTPLHEIAGLLERHHIKRVPVTHGGRLVGIVSRANLLHGLAAKGAANVRPASADDRTTREQLLHALSEEVGLSTGLINVVVHDAVVQIWGIVHTETEKQAAQVAAENAPGIKAVENRLRQVPAWVWAE